MWDIRIYKLLETINWDEDQKEGGTYIYSAQFSKSYKHNLIGVSTCNNNGYIIFDMVSNNLPVTSSKILSKPCYAIDFSNNGNLFAYGTGDGNVRLLSLDVNKQDI